MNFTYKLKEPKSEKETLIYFRSYFLNENKNFIYSTGEKINPAEWDFENRQPNDLNGRTKRAENHRSIKKQLDRYSSFFTEIVNRYKNINEDLTLDILRQRFNEEFKKIQSKDDFFRIYDEFIEEKENDFSGNAISNSTLKRYKCNKTLLEDFEKKAKHKLSLGKFDEKTFNKFLKFCVENREHSANTVHRNIGLLKTFLLWAFNKKYSFNNSFLNFKKPPKFRTDEIALNIEQVEEIYAHDFSKNKKFERVRDLFVFGCVTGMRFGNYSTISKNDVQGAFIRVIDLKSKSKNLSIPLNNISKSILEKYEYDLPTISNQKMNDYLKELAELAEIDELVTQTYFKGNERIEEVLPKYSLMSTHAGRRTFVCNALSLGIPPQVVMKWTGHSDYKAMKPYIDIADEIKATAMEKFDSF